VHPLHHKSSPIHHYILAPLHHYTITSHLPQRSTHSYLNIPIAVLTSFLISKSMIHSLNDYHHISKYSYIFTWLHCVLLHVISSIFILKSKICTRVTCICCQMQKQHRFGVFLSDVKIIIFHRKFSPTTVFADLVSDMCQELVAKDVVKVVCM